MAEDEEEEIWEEKEEVWAGWISPVHLFQIDLLLIPSNSSSISSRFSFHLIYFQGIKAS